MRPRATLAALLATALLVAAGCAAPPGPVGESSEAGTGFRAPD